MTDSESKNINKCLYPLKALKCIYVVLQAFPVERRCEKNEAFVDTELLDGVIILSLMCKSKGKLYKNNMQCLTVQS